MATLTGIGRGKYGRPDRSEALLQTHLATRDLLHTRRTWAALTYQG